MKALPVLALVVAMAACDRNFDAAAANPVAAAATPEAIPAEVAASVVTAAPTQASGAEARVPAVMRARWDRAKAAFTASAVPPGLAASLRAAARAAGATTIVITDARPGSDATAKIRGSTPATDRIQAAVAVLLTLDHGVLGLGEGRVTLKGTTHSADIGAAARVAIARAVAPLEPKLDLAVDPLTEGAR